MARAGLWDSTKKFFTKSPLGRGITSGVGFGLGAFVIDKVVGMFSDDPPPQQVDFSGVNQRLNKLDEQLNSINPQLANIRGDISSIKERLNTIEGLQLSQAKVLQAHTLMLEKIQLEQLREKVVQEVTSKAEKAFDLGPEKLQKFITDEMKLVGDASSFEEQQRLAVLHGIMSTSLEYMNHVPEGTSLSLSSIEDKMQMLELIDVYQKEVQGISSENSKFYSDSIRRDSIEFLEKANEQLLNHWQKFKPSTISLRDLESLKKKVDKILNKKGTQEMRELLAALEIETKDLTGPDRALYLYQQFSQILKSTKLTNKEFSEIKLYLDEKMGTQLHNFTETSPLTLAIKKEIADLRRNFARDVFERDVEGPCVSYLKKQLPGISSGFLGEQVKLSFLRFLWAYADITGEKKGEFEKSISASKAHQSTDADLLLKYVKKESLTEEKIFKIVKGLQSKKYQDRESEYLIKDIDAFALRAARENDLEVSAHGLLSMIHEAYSHPEYTGIGLEEIEQLVDKSKEKIERKSFEIQSLLEDEKCSEYRQFLVECKKLNSNYSLASYLGSIPELNKTVMSISGRALSEIDSVTLNNRAEVERDKANKLEQQRLEGQRQKRIALMNKCMEQKFKLAGDIVYVYKDHEVKNYEKFIQPGLEVFIDFTHNFDAKGSYQVLDDSKQVIGWVKPQSVNFASMLSCAVF